MGAKLTNVTGALSSDAPPAEFLDSVRNEHTDAQSPLMRTCIAAEAEPPLLSRCIAPAWATIREIRTSVCELLHEYPSEFTHAATMVCSELLENAIKYGEGVAAAPMIQFQLGMVEKQLQVRVINGSTDSAGVSELLDHVRLATESDDKAALYQARLEELLVHPCASTKLGIYRIAYEGCFDIHCTYIDEVVTVTATRSLP